MSSANKTAVLQLNSWQASDKPAMADFLSDNSILESSISTSWIKCPFAATCPSSGNDGTVKTYTISLAGDATAFIGVGMKIKVYQVDSFRFFIVHSAPVYSSGFTTFIVWGGTDYSLTSGALGSLYFSRHRAPFGFPLDKNKWKVEVIDNSNHYLTPTNNAWISPGVGLAIPVGLWDVDYTCKVRVSGSIAAGGYMGQITSLSSSSASNTNTEFTAGSGQDVVNAGVTSWQAQHVGKGCISLSSKTYFSIVANFFFGGTVNANCGFAGAQAPTRITAVDAYL